MNYYPVTDGRTDRWTDSDAYEPTVQYAQEGSKNHIRHSPTIHIWCQILVYSPLSASCGVHMDDISRVTAWAFCLATVQLHPLLATLKNVF